MKAKASYEKLFFLVKFHKNWAGGGMQNHLLNCLLDRKPLPKEAHWRDPASIETFKFTTNNLLTQIHTMNCECEMIGHDGGGTALFDVFDSNGTCKYVARDPPIIGFLHGFECPLCSSETPI